MAKGGIDQKSFVFYPSTRTIFTGRFEHNFKVKNMTQYFPYSLYYVKPISHRVLAGMCPARLLCRSAINSN